MGLYAPSSLIGMTRRPEGGDHTCGLVLAVIGVVGATSWPLITSPPGGGVVGRAESAEPTRLRGFMLGEPMRCE